MPKPRRKRTELHKCQTCDAKLTDANWTPSMQKYRRYVCAPCWSARQKAYASKDPDHKSKKQKQSEQRKAGWDESRVAAEAKKNLARWRKRNYGISQEDFDAKLSAQNGKCAICQAAEPKGRGHWHLDHCHETKQIRGILCHFCNLLLGMAKDSPERLLTAAKYLKTYRNRADHKPSARVRAGGKAF